MYRIERVALTALVYNDQRSMIVMKSGSVGSCKGGVGDQRLRTCFQSRSTVGIKGGRFR